MENNRENTFNLKRYQSRFVLQKRFRKSGNTERNNQFFTLTFHFTLRCTPIVLFLHEWGLWKFELKTIFSHFLNRRFPHKKSAGNDGVHRGAKKKEMLFNPNGRYEFHTRYSDEYASRRCIFNAHIQLVYISVAPSPLQPPAI